MTSTLHSILHPPRRRPRPCNPWRAARGRGPRPTSAPRPEARLSGTRAHERGLSSNSSTDVLHPSAAARLLAQTLFAQNAVAGRHPSSAGTPFAAPEISPEPHKARWVLIIKFKHVTGGYVPVVCRALRGKGGDSVVLLRERAHDEDDHEPQHELLLGRQRRGERVREDRHVH